MIKYLRGFGFAQTFLDNLSFKKFQLETDEKKNILGNWFFILIVFPRFSFESFRAWHVLEQVFNIFLSMVFSLLYLVLIPNDLNSQTISLHY